MPADGPRLALTGPAHLLHVDYEGGVGVDLYSVVRRDGTEADCAGPALKRVHLHGHRTNPIDVDVGARETVCLVRAGAAPVETGRPLKVSWHALRSANQGPSLAAALPISW